MSEKSNDKAPKEIKEKKRSVADYFRDYKNEFKKIIWPTRKLTFKDMGVVVSTIAVGAVFVGILDYGLTLALSAVMKISV